MYEAFYGLNEKPFNLTPDPRFLYLSSKHKEAFAHLLYGIRNRSGFVMVSGEIGTGKTTICRSLLKQLDPDTEVGFIFNPKLSPTELLKTINSDFGIASKADTIRGLVEELNTYLLDRAGKGKSCVLIIDEAQNLGTETLEQVRLLSNLETETEKLLQIVLIGQPELAEKLALNELRQLNQRITARYHLGSLSKDETLHYIAFRLRVAGGQKKVRFTRSAVGLVYKLSRGTPRVINALCDRALLIGYTKEARTITPAIVRKAANEVQGAPITPSRRSRLLPVSVLATAALAVIAALFVRGDISLPVAKPIPDASAREQQGTETSSDFSATHRTTNAAPRSATDSDLPVAPVVDPTRGIAEAAILKTPPNASSDGAATDAGLQPKSTPEHLAKVATIPGGAETAGMAIVEKSPEVHRGLDAIVRAWKPSVVQVAPVTVTRDSVQRFATANGLRLAALSLSVDELAMLGLPALLRARNGEWAALIRIENGKATLIGREGAEQVVELDALRDQYRNEAYVLWKDPAPGAKMLRASMRSDEVEQMQRDLQQLGLLEREPTGVYDAATIDSITKIQRTTGLDADGVAGPQTRMVLLSWLGEPGTPRLSEAGFTESLRDRVLAREGMVIQTPAAEAESTSQEPEPLPDVIEPALDDPPAQTPADEADSDALPDRGAPADTAAQTPGGGNGTLEKYTPLLPVSPANAPTVTPSATRGVPIRPANGESLQR